MFGRAFGNRAQDKLRDGIRAGLEKGLEEAVPNMVDTVIDSLMAHPVTAFRIGAQYAYMTRGQLSSKDAWDRSLYVVKEWLRSEKIKFGDPRFGWSAQDGYTLAIETDIEYWDE